MLEIYNVALIQQLANSCFTPLAWSGLPNSWSHPKTWPGEGMRRVWSSLVCCAFSCVSTAHSLSTCSSLEQCGTWKRLMSIETFRHNQITDKRYTDISWLDKQHARCRHTTGGRYYCSSTRGIVCRQWVDVFFSNLVRYHFQLLF